MIKRCPGAAWKGKDFLYLTVFSPPSSSSSSSQRKVLCDVDYVPHRDLLYPCWMLVKRVLSLFLSFLWLCVCTQVHMLWSPCGGHEDNPRSQSSSTLFETRSLFCFPLCMPGWVPHDLLFQEPSCLHLVYPRKCIVITGNCGTVSGFCLGSGTLSWTLKPPMAL